jgi:predicted ATPase
LAVQTEHMPSIVNAHSAAGLFAAVRHKPVEAASLAKIVVRLAREHGLLLYAARGMFLLGWARCREGDGEGEAAMRDALAQLRDMKVRIFEPLTGTLLAEIEAGSGRLNAAMETPDASLNRVEHTGERWFEAEVHRAKGNVLLQMNSSHPAPAEAALMRALEVSRAQRTRTFELRAALSLAKLYHATGRSQAACDMLTPAVAGFIPGPELPEVAEAKRLLACHEVGAGTGSW